MQQRKQLISWVNELNPQKWQSFLVAGWESLEPDWLIGVGGFAKKRAEEALKGIEIKIGMILHPSPASPAANRGWVEAATNQLKEQEIWK